VHAHRAERPGSARPAAAVGGVAVVALGLLGFVGRPWATNDTLWALVWGRQIVQGDLPAYGVSQSSTPHPLTNLIAASANLMGTDAAYWILAGLVLLAFGVIVVLTFQLARECFGLIAALFAAAVVTTSPSYINAGGSAQMDLVFAALVLVGLRLAMQRRPGWAMGALAFAGLMRPEAWVLSLAYFAWLLSRRREQRLEQAALLRFMLLAGSGPVLWLAADLIVTGHPLYALTYTQDEAHALMRTTGLRNVPSTAHIGLENILSRPVLVAGAFGFLGALVERRALPVLALGALSGITYLGYGVAAVSLLDRYLLLPSIVLAITLGYALTGWTHVRGATRAIWAGAALLAVAYGGTALAGRIGDIRFERARIRQSAALVADLKHIDSLSRPRAILRGCRRLLVRDNRPVALLMVVLDREPGEVQDARDTRIAPGDAFVTASRSAIAGNKLGLFPDVDGTAAQPASFEVAFRGVLWELSARNLSQPGTAPLCRVSS
jgi:hypothetical protein